MAQAFGCPNCGSGITVHFARAGDLVYCRSCGTRVPVPELGRELPIRGPTRPAGVDRPATPEQPGAGTPTASWGPPPSVGEVLNESFRIFFSHFPGIIWMMSIALSPLLLMIPVFAGLASIDSTASPALIGGMVGWMLLAGALYVILLQVSMASITLGVFQVARGRPMLTGECLKAGFRRLPSVVGVSILTGFLIMLGFVACIVPGILVATALAVAIPVTVVEGLGPEKAISRSRQLTKGARGMVFGVFAVLWVLQLVVSLVSGLAATLPLLSTVLSIVIGVVTGGLGATALSVLYFRLRSARESIRIDDIAAVFE